MFCSCQTKNGSYTHKDYVSQRTVEEHERILRQRTEEIFRQEILNGEIIDYKVEIVYAFYDDDPEYFLIEVEYAEEFEVENPANFYGENILQKTKYKHLIGFHNNDYYESGLPSAGAGTSSFVDGKSPWAICDYNDYKKYYGNCKFGVEKQGEIVCFEINGDDVNEYIPTIEQQKNYMKLNPKWDRNEYKANENYHLE